MAFPWRKKDAKGLLSVFRVIKTYGGTDEAQKKYSRKEKLNGKNSFTPINPKKIFILCPKKNSYKEFDNRKKNSCRSKIPLPAPHNFSNGPSLIVKYRYHKRDYVNH